MFAVAGAALIVSAGLIVLLCMHDPKRLRTAGRKTEGMAPARRRMLVAAACLPGLACALLGDSGAFLMWLGGCALFGWALAGYYRSDSTKHTPR